MQAGYAVGGLRSDIKSKVKTLVRGHYGIPGEMTPGEVKEAVEWLCAKSNFTCGDLSIKVSDRLSYPLGCNDELVYRPRAVTVSRSTGILAWQR